MRPSNKESGTSISRGTFPQRTPIPILWLMLQQAMMPSPPSIQGHRTSTPSGTGPMTSKIRDSCESCALSKVRCNKEKPTCSRCARRGLKCQYLITKRPGRKRDPSTNVGPDLSERKGSWPGTADLSTTPPTPSSASGAECSSTSNMYSDLFMPLEPSLSSTLAGMSSEFDEFYTSSIHNLLELESLDTINFAQEYNDIEKLLIPDHIDLGLALDTSSFDRPSAFNASSPSSNGRTLSTSNSYTSLTSIIDPTRNSTCSCLMLALEYMKKFSSTKTTACALSNNPDNATAMSNTSHSSNPPAHVVVMENKQTIEAVSDILQCSCAEDAYLLTMLSMVVFKILGRYTAAARKQPGEVTEECDMLSRNTSTLSGYYPDERDRGRIAAQLILSELHHVQRLVNQLSPRLKHRGMGAAGKVGGTPGARDDGGDREMSSISDGEPTMTTFLATTLDQIEIDLRRCLSTLSSEIINMLRQS